MKKLVFILTIVFASAAVMQGCYYDKAELVYPTNTCDTTNLTYTAKIQPIIQEKCYGSSCHSGDNPVSGTRLDSYRALSRIDNTELIRRITLPPSDADHMPRGRSLSDCQKNLIIAWYAGGAPE